MNRLTLLDAYTLNPGDNPWDALTDLPGLDEVILHERSPTETLVERAQGSRLLLTNKTPLSADTLAQLPELAFIGVLATGTDGVDLAAAKRLGITVSNLPAYSVDAVAQHVFALLLQLSNRVYEHAHAVREQAWCRCPDFSFWNYPMIELAGRTLGIAGYGRIGKRVAEIGRAFGMKIRVCTRSQPAAGAAEESVHYASLQTLFAESDVLSLHLPLTPDTRECVNAPLLASMRPDAFLINTARGGLIDEPALAAALENKQLAGAALDVLSQEPPPPDNPLLQAPRCFVTPHLAWSTLAARQRAMRITVENVQAFLAGNPINTVA